MRGVFEPWHLLILLLIILVLFGGKKLPEAARGLGRSMRIFKSEVKEMKDDDKASDASGPLEGRVVGQTPAAPVVPGPVAAPAPVFEPVREPEPVLLPDERRPGL